MTTGTIGERVEPRLTKSAPGRAEIDGQGRQPKRETDRLQAVSEARSTPHHERRDERVHLRVRLPFDVFISGSRLTGDSISVSGFSVEGVPPRGDGPMPVEIAIHCNGFRAAIPAVARPVGIEAESARAGFEFVEIGDQELAILRKIIQAHLAGTHLSVDQMAATEDPQTVRNRVKKTVASPGPGLGLGKTIAIFSIIVLLLVGFGAALFEKIYVIKPNFAAVTAPSIAIYAPIDGELTAHQLNAGQQVSRDQELVNVVDPEAKAELVLAEATLSYNDRLLENLRESLKTADNREISFMSGGPISGGAPVLTKLTPLETRSRIRELESTHDFAVARIEALRARASMGTIHAPCDCLIQSIRSGEGGYWVQKGALIAQLIETGPEDVSVEALVHLDTISQIEPNKRAVVVMPTTGETREARVASIQLESQNIERAGFPEWARQDMSHGSVILSMEEPLPPQFVGHPVEVRFLDTKSFGGQVLASVFNSLGSLYRDWVGEERRADRPAAAQAAR